MTKLTIFPVSILLMALAGCASQGSLDLVRTDVDAVKTRLYSVEKDLGGTREQSVERFGAIEKSYKSDVAAVRKLSADIQATTDSIRTEMRALGGKVDDLAISLKKPAEDIKLYQEDADKRILALEDRIIKQQKMLDDLAKKNAEQLQQKDGASTADSLYMKGYETFKTGDLSAAREIFAKFLEQYPKHDLAANSHYWTGETYYGQKEYEQAILAFQDVIKNFPQKEKVPASMLKQALSFKAIKDAKSAKFILKKLTEGFPKSEEAKRARELLKGL
jgi:tol-pal system protein YbgF